MIGEYYNLNLQLESLLEQLQQIKNQDEIRTGAITVRIRSEQFHEFIILDFNCCFKRKVSYCLFIFMIN